MNVQTNQNGRLFFWVAFTLLILGVGLGDTAIIAWYASVAGFWQLLASLLSFTLVSAGLLFTVWRMKQ